MDAKAKTVLIVEDNELNMKLFHDLLEAHGYQIVGTRNGIEALDLARKHKPDLVLMDIQLPEVSGLEVTKWLKDDPQLKSIPVVADFERNEGSVAAFGDGTSDSLSSALRSTKFMTEERLQENIRFQGAFKERTRLA